MQRILRMLILFFLILPSLGFAEVREIIAEGTYNMGDGETPTVAESRALLQAKRVAIEQAGTYIESYSKVQNFQLTYDEIQVLASGMMELIVLDKKRTVLGDGIIFWVKVKAKVSTDKIDVLSSRAKERANLENYRNLKQELEKSQKEIEDLKNHLREAKSVQEKDRVKEVMGRNEKQFQSNELVEKGMKFFWDKDFDTAISTFKAALEIDQDNAVAYAGIGSSYLLKGKDTLAIEYLSKAIALKPKLIEAYVLRGAVYCELQHQYYKAILDFSRALAIDQNYPDAYWQRGQAYERIGPSHYDRAIENYTKAIFLKPTYELAIRARCHLYLKIKKYEQATIDCERLIALNPKDPLYIALLGEIFENTNQVDRAIEYYNKAIVMDPNYTSGYSSRGSAYLKKGEYQKAIEDFNKVVAKNPKDISAYTGLGLAYNKLGNVSQSIINFKEAARLGNKEAQKWVSAMNQNGKEWFDKGLFHLSNKEYDQAIESFTVVIALDPNYLSAYGTRGIAYGQKGLHDKAIEDFNKVIALNSHESLGYNGRGITYYRKGQYDKAIADFNQAIAISPNYFLTYTSRGYVYLDLEKLQMAEIDFEKALELTANDTLIDPYIGLAIVYFRQGKKEEAKNYYRKAIKIDPLCKGGGEALEKERGYFYTPSQKKTINEILKLSPNK